jgi:predicted esterase
MPVDGPDFLHDLVEAIKAKYPINPRRVYLFGHSAGASFALNMSLLESEYFAASAVHAGALQTYRVIDLAKRKTPMAIWVGTKDQYFSLKDVRGTRDELNKHGFAVELTEIPNHDHSYYNIAAKLNQDIWGFLKKYELAADQRYEQYNINK